MHLSQRTLYEVAGVTTQFLVLMRPIVKVFSKEVQRRALHGCVAIELKSSTLCIDDTEPAHVGVVALLLWTDIGKVLVLHLIIIYAQELA